MNFRILALLFFIVSIFFIFSCPVDNKAEADNEEITKYTLSGTATCFTTKAPPPTNPAQGKTAYFKLVAQGAPSTTAALYSTTVTFGTTEPSNYTVSYSISNVNKGSYTAYVFIDMNSNASSSNPLPDGGDYYATTDCTISSDTTLNINDNYWSKL